MLFCQQIDSSEKNMLLITGFVNSLVIAEFVGPQKCGYLVNWYLSSTKLSHSMQQSRIFGFEIKNDAVGKLFI